MDMICKLSELMSAKGINQKQLSIETGLSPTTISKLYRNQLDRFDKKTILTLCKYFECKSVNELIEIAFN
jgi:putative transcriptional regulator